jgi:hypothetical protein
LLLMTGNCARITTAEILSLIILFAVPSPKRSKLVSFVRCWDTICISTASRYHVSHVRNDERMPSTKGVQHPLKDQISLRLVELKMLKILFPELIVSRVSFVLFEKKTRRFKSPTCPQLPSTKLYRLVWGLHNYYTGKKK